MSIKTNRTKILFISILVFSFCIATKALGSTALKEQIQALPFIEQNNIKVTKVKELTSLYLVQGTRQNQKRTVPVVVTVTKDFKYISLGRTVDAETGYRLHIKSPLVDYKNEADFVYGNGPTDYLIFTDPACPFCKQFEKQLAAAALENKITLHYFIYPILINKPTLPMSRYVLNQVSDSQKHSALKTLLLEQSNVFRNIEYTQDTLSKLDGRIEQVKGLATELGVRGTPTIIREDGQQLTMAHFFEVVQ